MTPLLIAVEEPHIEIVEYLVQKADINIQDKEGVSKNM